MRHQLFIFSITSSLALVGWTLASAQDPFSVTQQPAAANSAEASVIAQDPHIKQLNEFAGRDDDYLAAAISQFTRIKNWNDADRWLTQGVVPINDTSRLANIGAQIGTDNLIRLSSAESLSESSQSAIDKLQKATREFAESKDRLRKAIDDLDNPSTDVQLQAARIILSGGLPAVKLLIEATTSDSPTAPRGVILNALARLGGNGVEGLRQLALYGDSTTRLNSLRSTMHLDAKGALPDLVTAIHANDSEPAERKYATRAAERFTSQSISRQTAIGYLSADLKRQRQAAASTENGVLAETAWSVSDDRKSVTALPVRSIHIAYRRAYDSAARLRRLGSLPPQAIYSVLAADLSYRMMIDPDWGSAEQVDLIVESYGDMLSTSVLSESISVALNSDDQPALVGLLRVLGRKPELWNVAELLAQSGRQFSPVVLAAMSSDPRVRYEAAIAITRLTPPPSYAGSSHVTRCLGEMSGLGDRPTAVLLETRADVALRQEVILTRLGFDTQVVGTAVRLEHMIADGGDIRMILSKTQIWDIPPVELIDRVRRQPRGKSIPIVFYGGLIDEDDVVKELNSLADSDISLKAEADEYISTLKDSQEKAPFSVLIERVRDLRFETHYLTAQAKLNQILNDYERLDTLTPRSEQTWASAVGQAKRRIHLLKIRDIDASPFIETKPDPTRLGIRSKRWPGVIELVDRPRTSAAFADLLQDIELDNRLPALTMLDRQLYRQFARDYLSSKFPRTR